MVKTSYEIQYVEGQTQFTIGPKNGTPVFQSKTFLDASHMKTAAKQLRADPIAMRVERKTNSKGEFLFELHDPQHHLLGKSLPYSSEAGMENGIKNLMTGLGH